MRLRVKRVSGGVRKKSSEKRMRAALDNDGVARGGERIRRTGKRMREQRDGNYG